MFWQSSSSTGNLCVSREKFKGQPEPHTLAEQPYVCIDPQTSQVLGWKRMLTLKQPDKFRGGDLEGARSPTPASTCKTPSKVPRPKRVWCFCTT